MSEPASTRPGPAAVSLADEEGVRRIPTDTVFGLWAMVNNPRWQRAQAASAGGAS